MPKPRIKTVETLIIGTGFGGLCMGAKLREAGRFDFVILEKADAIGGTWRENTYPGAECDIPSALYSFSFWQNPTWDFKWAKQPQILQYMNDFADAFDLRAHIHHGQAVDSAVYNEETKRWRISCLSGEVYDCRFFVPAVGQLHHLNTPKFKGAEDFKGKVFHSGKWDHSVDLAGKSVAVIGNAASAVQFIPEIAETVGHLTVYQRTPNWVIYKKDRPYYKFEKALGKAFPPYTSLYRLHLWSLGEYGIWPMIKGNKLACYIGRKMCKGAIEDNITDPKLRDALLPDYPIGAKRILLSDKFYPALARENVTLEIDGIAKITKDGIETKSGTEHKHDVLIYGTGFKTNPFLQSLKITGRGNKNLRDHWDRGAFAYLGVSTSGFPNMFILYGPNTNTGHTSIIFKLENQVNYILKLMALADPDKTIEVRDSHEAAFNVEMQDRLAGLAWSKIDASWYKDGDRVTNNWPGSSREYKRRMKTPIISHFDVKS